MGACARALATALQRGGCSGARPCLLAQLCDAGLAPPAMLPGRGEENVVDVHSAFCRPGCSISCFSIEVTRPSGAHELRELEDTLATFKPTDVRRDVTLTADVSSERVLLRASFASEASDSQWCCGGHDIHFCVAPCAPHPEGLLFPDPHVQRLLRTLTDLATDTRVKGPVPLTFPFFRCLPGETHCGEAFDLGKLQLEEDATAHLWVFMAVGKRRRAWVYRERGEAS